MKKITFLAVMMCLMTLSYGQVYYAHDFSEGQMPPTGWTIDKLQAQWSIDGGNAAGGTAPEAMFTYIQQIDSSRLISPVVDLSGVTSVTLSFSHFYDDYTGAGPVVGVATRHGGGNWTSVWEINPNANVGPETVILQLSDVEYTDFQFSFYINGNLYNIDYWYLDDVLLFNPLDVDAELKSIKLPSYVEVGHDAILTGVVKNIGSNNITSFDVSYSVEGGDPVVYSVTELIWHWVNQLILHMIHQLVLTKTVLSKL